MMAEETLLPFLTLLTGLLTGGLIGWLIGKARRARALSPEEIAQQYVPKPVYDQLERQADLAKEDNHEKEAEIRLMESRIAKQEQVILNMSGQMEQQMQEARQQGERLQLQFEKLANDILEEKASRFTQQNQQQLQQLLSPLQEHIQRFEEGVARRFIEETRDRAGLRKEIEQLQKLNQQLSADANSLVAALKGDNKIQGNWGEMQLQRLLEAAGLQKNYHFSAQPSFRDEDGRLKQPDFIIHLPEKKTLIVDSKVSLVAYEKYHNTDDGHKRDQALKAHIESLRQHIRGLSGKNYTGLYQIHTPDYLLLYVPIEPALSLALQEAPQLFTEALEANVVLVSNSTLLATMRTVSYIWQQEKQKRNVLEIARQSGLLYDKFCAFAEDLKEIGQRLDQAQGAYHGALNKLSDSKKFGDTLVGRAERIRILGAKASKQLPEELLQERLPEEDDAP
ncbi:DNA recombination protein RmuC [Phaeodactylibacter luteus]|nr:DNA recombination protein RmuC [Phaeodactylibacter luteus]